MSLKDIEIEFTSSTEQIISAVPLSHKVERGHLKDSTKSWIKKEARNPTEAKLELLAQEFFRLIIPHQGETRLLENKKNGVHYILSEEVVGYRPLPVNEVHHFISGRYQGLGHVLLCAMFLQESDLKNGNIGLDARGKVHKIDGDWCFSEGRYKHYREYRLTAEAIAMLPYPKDFYAYNWLDLKRAGVSQINSELVSAELIRAPQFRLEVNQALLRILLLSDTLIKRFVDIHMHAGAEQFLNIIKTRAQQLQTSAINDPSFQEYLSTTQAQKDSKEFLNYINLMYCHDGIKLVPAEEEATLGDVIDEQFITLNQLAHNVRQVRLNEDEEQVNYLIEKNQRSIAELEALAMIDTVELTLYIFELRQLIKNKGHDLEQLSVMDEELTAKLKLCQFKQVKQCYTKNQKLIQKISEYSVNNEHLLLESYVTQQREHLRCSQYNFVLLKQMKLELQKKVDSLDTNEVKRTLSTAPPCGEKKNGFFPSFPVKIKNIAVSPNESQYFAKTPTTHGIEQKKRTLIDKTKRVFSIFNKEFRRVQAEQSELVVQKESQSEKPSVDFK